MQFIVVPRGRNFTVPNRLPAIALRRDLWDDAGFQTLFDAHLYIERGQPSVSLGPVKIMRRGQQAGQTEMPRIFAQLDSDYCSLGQAFSYYEALNSLPRMLRDDILEGLRDLAANPLLTESFDNEPALAASLMRYGNAELAFRDAVLLLRGAPIDRSTSVGVVFETSVGGEVFSMPFAFADREPLPGRINVVIGYNGCGKTQLLANLANVANADHRQRADADFIRRFGRFAGDASREARFSSVIAISYSAFDTFELPGKTIEEEARLQISGEVRGYTYCGLRRYNRDAEDLATSSTLKGANEVHQDMLVALARARSSERIARLRAALEPLGRESSFRRIALSSALELDDASQDELFNGFSTGHKLVLNIVIQLVAHLEPGSLVLLDEPESHLHPPLLAALLKSITIALEAFDSYAVVATHSPVLLQEIPRRYVRVLQRFGALTVVSAPEMETFAENMGLLTRHVFNLDSTATDYHSTLQSLSEALTLGEILDLFDGEMSVQALTYLASIGRGDTQE